MVVLPEFQKFLTEQGIVAANKSSFYAFWVSRFLKLKDRREKGDMEGFLEDLRNGGRYRDWQIEQAGQAVELYLKRFLNSGNPGRRKENTGKKVKGPAVALDFLINQGMKAVRLKHYSVKTEKAYLGWVKRYYKYLVEMKGDFPGMECFTSKSVKDFLTRLAVTEKVAASTQNQAFNGVLFLFKHVLNKPLRGMQSSVRAKKSLRLPVVLSGKQVAAVLRSAAPQHQLAFRIIYGTGMRINEFIQLRVKDLDFELNTLTVAEGKGNKSRALPLPFSVREELTGHLEKVQKLHQRDLKAGYGWVDLPATVKRRRPKAAREWGWQFAFPSGRLAVDEKSGAVRRWHISEKTLQAAMSRAVRKSGIQKHATVHTLRHSYATHQLMRGVNIRQVQEMLGHKNLQTTMVYTHVVKDLSGAPESPLDSLPED